MNRANTMNVPTKMTAKQLTGYDRLHNARLNKGTAFTEAEQKCLQQVKDMIYGSPFVN